MTDWYVANTHVNAENTAAAHLARQGFAVYLPKYMKLRRHARRQDMVPRPLFPRYLFVGVGPENARWRAIHSTIGISNLVSFGSHPARVEPAIIDELRRNEDVAGMIAIGRENRFNKGDRVQLVGGALCEQVGLFDRVYDNERVIVLFDLLGQQVEARVSIEAVQACN